jgi:hypothetical protein
MATTALQTLKRELTQAEAQLAQQPIAQRINKIKAALAALGGSNTAKPRRRMSAETREKLRQAGLRRWHGKSGKSASKVPAKS